MTRSCTREVWAPFAVLLALLGCGELTFGRSPEEAVREGERLFVKSFTSGPTPTGGDGLGPLFNHVSCVACHRQGAIGGAGDIEFNVTLLSAQVAPGKRAPESKVLLRTLRSIHPAFVAAGDRIVPTILLHRFGVDERYFDRWTALGGKYVPLDLSKSERLRLQQDLTKNPLPMLKRMNNVQLMQSQRNTTALFGAGLIDRLPDQVFHDLAKRQADEGKVSGRVPPIGPDKVGRFGWRGQVQHLHDFVLGACSNEMGLEVPNHQQPMNPLRPTYRPKGFDLTEEQCQSLTLYVATLAPPKQTMGATGERSAAILRGRQIFMETGCADCHVERLGSVDGIYSDLLLHDMGAGLADPVLAEATLKYQRTIPFIDTIAREVPQITVAPTTGYYGGSMFQLVAFTGPQSGQVEIKDQKSGDVQVYQVQPSNLQSEWRTPPLWGVADSAPYLHDGRSPDLVDAIKAHGGEAASAAQKFLALNLAERKRLLAFLRSLEAPDQP